MQEFISNALENVLFVIGTISFTIGILLVFQFNLAEFMQSAIFLGAAFSSFIIQGFLTRLRLIEEAVRAIPLNNHIE